MADAIAAPMAGMPCRQGNGPQRATTRRHDAICQMMPAIITMMPREFDAGAPFFSDAAVLFGVPPHAKNISTRGAYVIPATGLRAKFLEARPQRQFQVRNAASMPCWCWPGKMI